MRREDIRHSRYTKRAESCERAAPREQANSAEQGDPQLGSEVCFHKLLTLRVTHK